jgi:hypothetical protein
VRLRAHILLLLFTSPATIARWRRRFEAGGVDEVVGRARGRRRSAAWAWAAAVVTWVLTWRPADFGFARSRWSREAVAVVLRDDRRTPVSRETVRRWLRDAGLVLELGLDRLDLLLIEASLQGGGPPRAGGGPVGVPEPPRPTSRDARVGFPHAMVEQIRF